jgi:RimJ/RimL family protein N-acetyltransferase
MTEIPTLKTERLLLRSLTLDDAEDIQRLAGDNDIARMTNAIPHPFEDGVAEAWINLCRRQLEKEKEHVFAVTLKDTCEFVGIVGMLLEASADRAEIGYWIGKPWWGKGYCTEAVRAAMDYGFKTVKLNRIHAHHFAHNPASGRVMQKLGMQHEGHLRQHAKRDGQYIDCEVYGILKEEWTS